MQIIYLGINQSSSWQNKAVPLSAQCLGSFLEGTSTMMMKLVEWPVVDKVPALSVVLYNGQR